MIGSPQAVAPPLLRHESLLKTALLRRKPRSAPSELPLYWFLPESPAHDNCCAGEMVTGGHGLRPCFAEACS